jgi:hypothetical protein
VTYTARSSSYQWTTVARVLNDPQVRGVLSRHPSSVTGPSIAEKFRIIKR